MIKCSICNREFSNKKSKSIHERWCEHDKKTYSHIDDAELKFLYYEHEYSIKDLSDFYNVGKGLLNHMKRIGIVTRTISESKKTSRTREKIKKNNLLLYDSPHNFCKDHPSRLKWESEMLKNEGISNVFLRASVKEKIKEILLERYGVDHPMHCKKIVDKVLESRGNHVTRCSKFTQIHKKVVDYLSENNIPHTIEFFMKSINKSYFYDIKIDNLLIEVNGDYWHLNPLKYKENDIINIRGILCKASDVWNIDKEKIDSAVTNGYTTLTLWENDINNNFELVKKQIHEALKN